MQDPAEKYWHHGWEDKLRARVASLGCEGIAEYLGLFPTESLIGVAERLGDDVGAVQLIMLLLQEAGEQGTLRDAAKDLLVRSIVSVRRTPFLTLARAGFSRGSRRMGRVVPSGPEKQGRFPACPVPSGLPGDRAAHGAAGTPYSLFRGAEVGGG